VAHQYKSDLPAILVGKARWSASPFSSTKSQNASWAHGVTIRNLFVLLAADCRQKTGTLDPYGHLFPDDMDRLAEGLDATRRAASAEIPAASPRPGGDQTVVDIEEKKQKRQADQRLRKWGRLDSNQRPTDYESAALTN
jgi:hypothetical protein